MKKTIVDLSYYTFLEKTSQKVINKCNSTLGYLKIMSKENNVFFVARTKFNFEPDKNKNFNLIFYKSKLLKKWQIPLSYNWFIKSLKPNYILVHGFGYVHYLIFLKIIIPKAKIVLQCNGYALPPSGIKKLIYKLADKFIDGYLFTGIENAKEWYEAKTLKKEKIFEVMEGSTCLKFDSNSERDINSFIWVGRLDDNKDPLTVLRAFNNFLKIEPLAKLTIVFHEGNLEDKVREFILQNSTLKQAINIIGYVEHELLEVMYNKNQYFILGSHNEGSGYALVEAMACGCVPIITNIPAFKYITDNGNCALLYSPSNDEELLFKLKNTQNINYYDYQTKVLKQFETKLSFEAIANQIEKIFEEL